MLITPFPSTGERHAVGFPLRQEAVDLGEQTISVGAREGAIAPKDPNARGVGERVEWHDRHAGRYCHANSACQRLDRYRMLRRPRIQCADNECSSIYPPLSPSSAS